ncbi:PREDICTED: uncharacterized protein LOC105534316 [Mandrillus leucophaeus]|uniref:uncharacterized protein LOC105534316 n=1 Tax=Mandrillus leucophaeus TaxID=9568 RepID=UPI0005F56B3A|nr:PREDICTED: uncharacterized protein LOC105534316 [Mandrillus leucophaeus]
MGLLHVPSRSAAAAARSSQRRAVSLNLSTQRRRFGDGGRGTGGNWHLRLCNRTRRRSPAAAFPWSEEEGFLASRFSPSYRPSFQTRPPVHRDPFRSPGSRWAGTGVTNSAQGVDYPSQPSLWLPSHLHPSSCRPLAPFLGWALETAPPDLPPGSVPSCNGGEKRRRALCHVGIGSGDVAAAEAQRAVPTHALPPGGRRVARRGEEGCAASSRSHLRVPLPASGTPGPIFLPPITENLFFALQKKKKKKKKDCGRLSRTQEAQNREKSLWLGLFQVSGSMGCSKPGLGSSEGWTSLELDRTLKTGFLVLITYMGYNE